MAPATVLAETSATARFRSVRPCCSAHILLAGRAPRWSGNNCAHGAFMIRAQPSVQRGDFMSVSDALAFNADVLPLPAPFVRSSRAASIARAASPFRTHEGVALAIGGVSGGALIGALLFFCGGELPHWMLLTVAIGVYTYVLHLLGQGLRDVLATRAYIAGALLCIHAAALVAWPFMLVLFGPETWQMWLGLPLALAASSLFFLIAHAPAHAMCRVGAHVSLIATLGAYQWLSSVISSV